MKKFCSLIASIFAAPMLAGCDYNPTESTHFTEAEYWEQSPSIVETRPAPDRISLPPDANWIRVSLPHTVPRPIVNTAPYNDVEWVTRWYKFQWYPVNRRLSAQAIYIPRRLFNFGDIDIYVDGRHINSSIDPDWNNPQLILIPPDMERGPGGGAHEILIGISVPPGFGHALSSIRVGTRSELMWRSDMRNLLQRGMPKATSIAGLVLGVLAFLFWYRRRNERAYLWFALLMPVYAIRSMHYYTIESTQWEELYWWLTSSSLGWLQVLTYFFAASLHGIRYRNAERFIVVATLVNSILSLLVQTLFLQATNISPLFYLVQMVISVVAIVMTTMGAFRSRSANAKLLAVILWLFLLMGAHDWLLQNWRIDVESIYLMPYGALLVVGVSLLAILQRYLAAVNEADLLNASLEEKLRERSRELEESHRKLRVIEQEQAVVNERQRLMREMHDGLGSSLMSSLVMVEQGKLDAAKVANVLRESIDDLKLTIDSLEPMGDDLLTLLGTLRYRLGKRLEAAGIKLEWHVTETPPLPWLNPTSSLQILRILQESLTNTLKHAGASVIRVATAATEEEVSIRLTDNGVGFDVPAARAQPAGRGLQNLERRAATLNGRIVIESRPGETSITLSLPLERRSTPRV